MPAWSPHKVGHWRLRTRIGASLVTAGHDLLTGDSGGGHSTPVTASTGPIDWDQANATAGFLTSVANAARCASRARTPVGEITGWRRVLDLPEEHGEAACELEMWADRLAADVAHQRRDLDPVIHALTVEQPSTRSWSLPIPHGARRGVWAGPEHWHACATAAIAAARDTIAVDCSPANVRALLCALAASVNDAGRGCTASTTTIACRAIERFGATCAVSTACRRLRTITRILTEADLLIVHARGRWLRSIERIAARILHGGRQHRAANVMDANVPAHLRPTTSPSPTAPGYARGLARRLAERTAAAVGQVVDNSNPAPARATPLSCEDKEPSTYTCGSSFSSPSGQLRVAHARASARANTEKSSLTENRVKNRGGISLRAWRITDDLTREGVDHGLDSGPYRHLVGCESGQMSRHAVARLIDELTPASAGTRDVLAGLVHAATSPTTGFTALGLATRPRSATAWFRHVLTHIDWTVVEDFPTWSKTSEAFALHWAGHRRGWRPVG